MCKNSFVQCVYLVVSGVFIKPEPGSFPNVHCFADWNYIVMFPGVYDISGNVTYPTVEWKILFDDRSTLSGTVAADPALQVDITTEIRYRQGS